MESPTWSPLTERGDVLRLRYSFGPGKANALAVKLDARRWMVVSPPIAPPPEVFSALDAEGEVAVLLAPNAYHHLGQAAWRARYPDAVSYAPRGARERLAARSPVPYRGTEELAERLPPGVAVILPDGQKRPDALVRITTGDETVWWMGDLFSNTTSADATWPLRVLSRLVGSGPGYRCNSWPEMVYVRDRAAWLRSIRAALEPRPPTIVVPAHGHPVTEETAARTAALIARAG